jgi:uncharacterized protein
VKTGRLCFGAETMRPSEALERKRDEVREAFCRYPVNNPRIFGSVARGDDAEGSDVDLLVDPLPGLTLLKLAGLEIELETLLGVQVDVVLASSLHHRIRSRVMAEARPL